MLTPADPHLAFYAFAHGVWSQFEREDLTDDPSEAPHVLEWAIKNVETRRLMVRRVHADRASEDVTDEALTDAADGARERAVEINVPMPEWAASILGVDVTESVTDWRHYAAEQAADDARDAA